MLLNQNQQYFWRQTCQLFSDITGDLVLGGSKFVLMININNNIIIKYN